MQLLKGMNEADIVGVFNSSVALQVLQQEAIPGHSLNREDQQICQAESAGRLLAADAVTNKGVVLSRFVQCSRRQHSVATAGLGSILDFARGGWSR